MRGCSAAQNDNLDCAEIAQEIRIDSGRLACGPYNSMSVQEEINRARYERPVFSGEQHQSRPMNLRSPVGSSFCRTRRSTAPFCSSAVVIFRLHWYCPSMNTNMASPGAAVNPFGPAEVKWMLKCMSEGGAQIQQDTLLLPYRVPYSRSRLLRLPSSIEQLRSPSVGILAWK